MYINNYSNLLLILFNEICSKAKECTHTAFVPITQPLFPYIKYMNEFFVTITLHIKKKEKKMVNQRMTITQAQK